MHYFLDPIKKYVAFKGRATRKEFWMFFLFYFIFSVILGFVTGLIVAFAHITNGDNVANYVGYAYALILGLPYIALYIRRIHDSGKSGWFILVPIYNWILLFIKGTDGDNKYGPNPNATTVPEDTTTSNTPLPQEQPPIMPQ